MSDVALTHEERIRARAYELWEAAGQPADSADHFWHLAHSELQGEQDGYDETVAESFPASDPPAHSGTT